MAGSPTTPLLPGYRDLTPLGRGGYSDVFRAYQEQFDRWVAVKILTFALTDDRSQRRFLRECRVAGRLSAHPNIVTVYDAGLSPDGRPFITMELFDGGSIGDRLRTRGAFEVADALRVAVALAGALETAHRAGVVHRDVKPANVLLAAYGPPALTDFGLSVLAERQEVSAGVDALTPYHAPPEVLERTTVTPRADVYSLASTTYAMLAGVAPHQRGGAAEPMAALLLRILQSDVPPVARADVPRSLDAALRGALARDAQVRTPSAVAFAQALQQVQTELGLEVTQPVVLDAPGGAEPVVVPPPAGVPEPSPTSLTVPGAGTVPDAVAAFGWARPDGDGTIGRDRLAPVPGAPDPAIAGPAPGEVMSPNGTPPAGPVPVAPPPPSWPVSAGPVAPPSPGPSRPAPAPAWTGGVLETGGPFVDGEATVHRSLVRDPRPDPLTVAASRRRWPWVVAGLALLAGAGSGGAVWWTSRDDERAGGDERDTTTSTEAAAQPRVPTGLTATENAAGVELAWQGDPAGDYSVLVLSENALPDLRPVEGATSLLLPVDALRPDEGYCFSVAINEVVLDVPAEQAETAFSPLQCIRGASPDTVRTE